MPEVEDDLAALTREPRILILDFERLPGLRHVFDQKPTYMPASKWLRLPSSLCFAAKWHGQRKVEFHAVWDDGGWDGMVRAHWALYDRADIIVTYFGTGADNKWARQDWLEADLPNPRPWKDVDLYRVNRAMFAFESGSLDHLTGRLNVARKTGRYDPHEAEAAYGGDETAQRALRRYNIGDVRATEAAFDKLRPRLGARMPHVGLWTGAERSCQVCGGTDFEPAGDVPAATNVYAGYRCSGCGTLNRSNHRRRAMAMRAAR